MHRLLNAALALLTVGLSGPLASAQTWACEIPSENHHEYANQVAVSEGGRTAVVRTVDEPSSFAQGGLSVFAADGSFVVDHRLNPLQAGEVHLFDVVFDGEEAVVVCGSVSDVPYAARIDLNTGVPTWEHSLAVDSGQFDFVVRTPGGGFVAFGTCDEDGKRSCLTSFSATGAVQWTRHYGELGSGDWPAGLGSLSNGDLVLVLREDSNPTVHRLTNLGLTVWSRRVAGEGLLIPYCASVDGQDRILIAGINSTVEGAGQFCVTLDGDGEVVVEAGYEVAAVGDAWPRYGSVEGTTDGGIVIGMALESGSGGLLDPVVVRLDPTGAVDWVRNYGTADVERRCRLTAMPDGGVVVVATGFLQSRVFRTRPDGALNGCSTLFTPHGPFDATADATPVLATSAFMGVQGAGLAIAPAFGAVTPLYQCGEPCTVTGATYGVGTPGTLGLVPNLTVADGLCLTWGPELRVDLGLGGAPAFVGVSVAGVEIPLLGGTVYLNPGGLVLLPPLLLSGPDGAPGAGGATLPLTGDLSGLVGSTVHLQAFVLDGGAPQGWAMTRAATLTGS